MYLTWFLYIDTSATFSARTGYENLCDAINIDPCTYIPVYERTYPFNGVLRQLAPILIEMSDQASVWGHFESNGFFHIYFFPPKWREIYCCSTFDHTLYYSSIPGFYNRIYCSSAYIHCKRQKRFLFSFVNFRRSDARDSCILSRVSITLHFPHSSSIGYLVGNTDLSEGVWI
jgi:hypothetical protein